MTDRPGTVRRAPLEPGEPRLVLPTEPGQPTVIELPDRETRSTGEPRKVVILSATYPYPADGGNKVVLSGLIDYFVDRVGADDMHYVYLGDPVNASTPMPAALHVVERPSVGARMRGIASKVLLRGRSLQEGILWSRATHERIAGVLDGIRPDLIVVDTVRLAEYVSALPDPAIRKVCYVDDLFSDRYRALIDLGRKQPDIAIHPLASFASVVPQKLQWLTEWRPTQRAILAFESRRVARSEVRSTETFDQCLLAVDVEAELLRSRTGAKPSAVRAITPLAQSKRTTRGTGYDGACRYLLLGTLASTHNDLAARWLVTDVLPILRRMSPDAHLDIVGKSPSPELSALVADAGDAVTLHGFVSDLTPFLRDACALLNPPSFGSGIKLKVLDALASGLPSVSTSVGARGIVDGPGQGVVIADTAEDFASAMVALQDPATNRRISREASAHHQRRFCREAVFAEYDTIFAGAPIRVP
jgi:hypothetical protein